MNEVSPDESADQPDVDQEELSEVTVNTEIDTEEPQEDEEYSLAAMLPDEVLQEIEELPGETRKRLVRSLSMSVFHSGPLPPPQLFKNYDETLPGAADRILRMAESEQKHRHEMERTIVNSDTKNDRLGLIFGGITVLIAVPGSLVLVGIDKPVAGIAVLFTAIGSVVGALRYSQSTQRHTAKARNDEPPADTE